MSSSSRRRIKRDRESAIFVISSRRARARTSIYTYSLVLVRAVEEVNVSGNIAWELLSLTRDVCCILPGLFSKGLADRLFFICEMLFRIRIQVICFHLGCVNKNMADDDQPYKGVTKI